MGKKTKSIKVTDIKAEKPWLKRTGDISYKEDSREMKKIILIVCEGQTEELYFKSFPVVSCTVTAFAMGQSKESLVASTIELKKADVYDEVWCVFDMDYNSGAKEISSFDNAINKAHKNEIKVAYSNDCFELWFCLHYEHIDQQHRRDFYFDYLSKKWNMNYSNDGKKYEFCGTTYSTLKNGGNQDLAIKRAEKLYKDQKHLSYSQQNPVTLVYLLVQLLKENMRD